MSRSSSINAADPPAIDEDPHSVIEEELGDHREALEALAEMDLGVLSADARRALEMLDQAQRRPPTQEGSE
ncbi:hypothetical protein AArcSl_1604 [Halalkaliarchaeum desulfuricum]|uniref:Uncharacterized protein n=1 Tax=Halalkaliarchaeum desulfuricum TaxID=2055893 RepID=A0A343TJG1_9EURY|nr:hypothetical protein [Halalkaliarchaeum desulfuricum]AUX09233.1 hypothetical protein AArcSl_1604 [Halalkaliarchaeum desulfuricum]